MAKSWENDSNFESLFDMFDPQYRSNGNITRPFSNIANKKTKQKQVEHKLNLDDTTTTTVSTDTENPKPNLELIASMIEGIGTNYSNEEVEKAYGIDGYMVKNETAFVNQALEKTINSATSSINANKLSITDNLPFTESSVQLDKSENKPDKKDKKKNIFKSLSQRKVRNLAMITLIENQKVDVESDKITNIIADVNNHKLKGNNKVSIATRVNNQNKSVDLNIIDTIDLTESDNSVILADKKTVNSSRNYSNNIYSNMNTVLPEINSNHKVMCWLNSNSSNSSNYINQLSNVAEHSNRPPKYVPSADVERTYQEIIKNKKITTDSSAPAKNTNTLWDSIKPKLNS